eukprot:CAMPEP_0119505068 /NCGR_PEP_ID=MMETSP1344-20130328/25724_1 /TAXON_ID=236787 /ORGANISM="Florenciella parvula, Strain CCMP2471" /LENGTH=62 /DNA_ID=CAMNT_0007541495 /DNA_START=12 /DNA_END=196 /DNA_ORIENTATION=+
MWCNGMVLASNGELPHELGPLGLAKSSSARLGQKPLAMTSVGSMKTCAKSSNSPSSSDTMDP